VPAEGRICLDILNMPPKGAWKPSLNFGTLLASVGLLLAHPNPDDGLVTDIVSCLPGWLAGAAAVPAACALSGLQPACCGQAGRCLL
jgi:hypothetical protein